MTPTIVLNRIMQTLPDNCTWPKLSHLPRTLLPITGRYYPAVSSTQPHTFPKHTLAPLASPQHAVLWWGKTGCKFQLSLRAPSVISEVNKLPRLKLMRSVYTQGSPRGPRDWEPSRPFLGFSSFICPFSPQHQRFLRPAGDRWGFSLRQDVPMRCKLVFPLYSFTPFCFLSLALWESLVCWRSVADVEGLKADTLSAIAEGASRITAERNKQLNLHGTVGESMLLLFWVPFGVFKLVVWFPGKHFTVTSLGIASI